MKAQRLRIRYRLYPPASELRPRDLASAWTDALVATGFHVAMSEGKRPTSQVALAASLTQGATSDWELLDVFLAEAVEVASVVCQLSGRLPEGVEAVGASEVGVAAPSLQSQLRWAEYEVDIPSDGVSADEVRQRVERLLAAKTLPSEYRRETKVREYDLRPLILALRVEPIENAFRLRMRLRAEQENTARADQVVLALGFPAATRIHRTRLGLDETSAAVKAFRRGGERLVY
jgi:radical SAM-linked protein